MLGVGAGGAQGQELERNSTPSFSFSLATSFAYEGASPLSAIGLRGDPLSACGEASFEPLLKQGYSGDSPVALERCAVRTPPRETNQLPDLRPRDQEARRHPDDILEDALPSSGKKPATLTLPFCVPAPNSTIVAVNLTAHVFTHTGFKPFPCDKSCGDLHW